MPRPLRDHNVLSSILIILGCIAGALVFLFLVTRTSNAPARKESNDFTGAVVAVIGTTYAVILAFMLSGVWNMFQGAQANEEQEANALINVWRIAEQLPPASGKAIQELCSHYAQVAVTKEWPAMAQERPMPGETTADINRLWMLAGQAQAHAGADSIAIYQMMEELRLLTEYRRIRIMQAREKLPGILWAVLIDLEQIRGTVEQRCQITLLALLGAEMHGKGEYRPVIGPHPVDDNFAPRRLCTNILGGHSGNPDVTRLFHVGAVITNKLQHSGLDCPSTANVAPKLGRIGHHLRPGPG